MKINWKWPKTPRNQYLPWYLILWHLMWAPFFITLRVLFCAAVFMTFLFEDPVYMAKAAWDVTA